MREALLLAAAFVATAPTWAHWTAFGEDGRNAVWYVDPESVRTVGKLRQVWAMKEMAQPVIDFDLSLYEVDCQGRRQRLLEYQSFRGRMGGGEPTRGGMVFGEWAAMPPGSVGNKIISAACVRS